MYVVPEDVERRFGSVLVHRIVFGPAFLAEARKHSWKTAIQEFVQGCLAAAPRPAPAAGAQPVPFAPRRS